MSLSMYQASVPVFQRTLGALDKILDKAATYASERKIEPATLLGARLDPDMFPLARQVQIATDHAKGASARLAGAPVPSFEDNEKTIAELKARIGKTLDFVGTFNPPRSTARKDATSRSRPARARSPSRARITSCSSPSRTSISTPPRPSNPAPKASRSASSTSSTRPRRRSAGRPCLPRGPP